jgi:hypothetical protein
MKTSKTAANLAQVLSIVGQQTNARKMRKCPLCLEWKLAVKQKPGGVVVVKCWSDNGKRHAKGEVWGHIVEKVKLGAVEQPQEETAPPPVKRKLSELPDWNGFPLDEGYANYKILPANFLRALPVTEQRVGGKMCTTFVYLLPPDGLNAAQLAEVRRYEVEQAARAPISGQDWKVLACLVRA